MAKEEAHAVDESGELTLFKSSSDAKRIKELEEDEKRRAASQPKALSQPKGRFGQGSAKTRDGKANVSKEQLTKTGLSLTQYMNQWKKTGKRPTKSSVAAKPSAKPGAKPGAKKKQRLILGKGAKIRPFGGAIARALLGEDEKFGGDRGAIDFIRRPKKKPKGKKMGGEVKKYRDGGLSRAQQNLLRSAREHSRNTGQALAPQYRARPKPPPSAPGMRGSGMGPGMKNGGLAKKQGANARLDESLGERRGKESTKSQSMKSRRNESRGARKPSRPQSAGAAKRGWGAAIR